MSDPARTRPTPDTPDAAPTNERLERVLADLRRDAQQRPGQYARDTLVPEGGE